MGWNPLFTHPDLSITIFQYPVSDRMGWNGWEAQLLFLAWYLSVSCIGSNGLKLSGMHFSVTFYTYFQYPVSDRMGWNNGVEIMDSRYFGSFSILYRIEWVETSQLSNSQDIDYPLSVSCIGSNGLKRGVSFLLQDCHRLSVSCIGSNGLKRPEACLGTSRGLNFQYPVSDRMGWNKTVVLCHYQLNRSFSILYRIEWVETKTMQ